MGTYEKRFGNPVSYRGYNDSDEVSEFSHDGSLTLSRSDLERGSDDDEDEGPACLLRDFTPDEDDLKYGNRPEHMRTSDYTPKFIQDHFAELGRLGLDDEGPANPSPLSMFFQGANDYVTGGLLGGQTSDDACVLNLLQDTTPAQDQVPSVLETSEGEDSCLPFALGRLELEDQGSQSSPSLLISPPDEHSHGTPKLFQGDSAALDYLQCGSDIDMVYISEEAEGFTSSFPAFSPDDDSNFQERTTRNSAQERAEMAVAFDCDIKEGVSHVTVGYGHMYDHVFGHFFHKRFQLHWAAVDDLLSRPWWSRVWVVQEVWSASDRAILQCGQQTIRWKTFQRAMTFHDHWDEIGYSLMDSQNNRAGIWTQLRRRYGLAIHLCKMTLLGGKLSDLLWNTWDRDATDPRDKVFAVLGLVGDGDTRLLTSPDYGKGVRQVFCETARDIIYAEGSLDILLAAGSPKGECDGGVLPSWVPDWRKKANETRPVLFVNRARLTSPYFRGSLDIRRVFGHGYAACVEEEAVAWFGDNLATLRTRAVLIDEVGSWCGIPQGYGPVMFKPIIDDACAVAYDALKDGTQYWWMEDEKEKVRA
ncbi:heterokaryon incompatibility protein, partial [Colletotrichum musicola]